MIEIDAGDLPEPGEPGLCCVCSNCLQPFTLTPDVRDRERGLSFPEINARDSGGVYGVSIDCPHCDHAHRLA